MPSTSLDCLQGRPLHAVSTFRSLLLPPAYVPLCAGRCSLGPHSQQGLHSPCSQQSCRSYWMVCAPFCLFTQIATPAGSMTSFKSWKAPRTTKALLRVPEITSRHSCSRWDCLCAALGSAGRGLGFHCSVQFGFALEVQWSSERWHSCASQGLPHRLTAAGLGWGAEGSAAGPGCRCEALPCGAQRHSPRGMLLDMHCFRQWKRGYCAASAAVSSSSCMCKGTGPAG